MRSDGFAGEACLNDWDEIIDGVKESDNIPLILMMIEDFMAEKFLWGVLGDPVGQSLSPQMHNAGLKALGMENVEYVRWNVPSGEFDEFMRNMWKNGVRGVSVTFPYKERVMAHCDELTEEAEAIGAVNTLFFRDGKLIGANTDWRGFGMAFEEGLRGVLGSAMRVLVLGAGGASKAVLYALNQKGIRPFLWNRTIEKIERLKKEKQFFFESIEDLLSLNDVDVIVNGTVVGLSEEDPLIVPLPLIEQAKLVFDLIYSPKTKLIEEAERCGIACVDGKRMLLWQGVKQFEIFAGEEDVVVPVEVMWNAIN